MIGPIRSFSTLATSAALAAALVSPGLLAAGPGMRVELGGGAPRPDGGDQVFAGVAPAGTQNTGNALFLGRNKSPSSSLKSFDAASRNGGPPVSDEDIEKNINAALMADTQLKGEVAFQSSNGVVTVAGRVANVGMIYRVISDIEHVEGVTGVNEEDLQSG